MIQTLSEIFMASFTQAVAVFFLIGLLIGIFITRMGAKVARLEGLIQGITLRLPKSDEDKDRKLVD